MKKTILLFLTSFAIGMSAQTTVTFEEFDLPANESNVDAGASGLFEAGNIALPNDYNAGYDSWMGWAISTVTDNTTPGYLNDESAITGSGFGGSEAYGVSFFFGGPNTMDLAGAAAGGVVNGMYITNATYAFFSMRDGDSVAKKFGGEDGTDPDYFLLTVKGVLNGMETADSVDFYLADYRFEDNAQDYIVDDWTWLDLTSLGPVDQLTFTLNSTDVGQFGMNTPAYFCVDNVSTADGLTGSAETLPAASFSLFPNPVADVLNINWDSEEEASLFVRSMDGRVVLQKILVNGQNQVQMSLLPAGAYSAQIFSGGRTAGEIIIKK